MWRRTATRAKTGCHLYGLKIRKKNVKSGRRPSMASITIARAPREMRPIKLSAALPSQIIVSARVLITFYRVVFTEFHRTARSVELSFNRVFHCVGPWTMAGFAGFYSGHSRRPFTAFPVTQSGSLLRNKSKQAKWMNSAGWVHFSFFLYERWGQLHGEGGGWDGGGGRGKWRTWWFGSSPMVRIDRQNREEDRRAICSREVECACHP